MQINRELNIIGVIGDVHAENKFLEKAIKFLKSNNVENIFCVGDIVDGIGDVNECCKILISEKVFVVLGNHDRWLLHGEMRNLKEATQPSSLSEISRSFLFSLPSTIDFPTDCGLALLCHGLGKNDMARLTPSDYGYAIEFNPDLQNLIQEQKYKYIINGHTHYKMVRNFGRLTIINAGTLKQEHEPGFLIVNFEREFIQFYKFNLNGAIEAAEKVSLTV